MAKVLIIDDSEFFRKVYAEGLSNKGFQVDTAADGRTGIEKMLADPPQLIFLDLIMPEMSGEDVIKEIQKHQNLHGIPVVMLTSISSQVVGADLLTAGPLAGYMRKDEATDEDVAKRAIEILGVQTPGQAAVPAAPAVPAATQTAAQPPTAQSSASTVLPTQPPQSPPPAAPTQ